MAASSITFEVLTSSQSANAVSIFACSYARRSSGRIGMSRSDMGHLPTCGVPFWLLQAQQRMSILAFDFHGFIEPFGLSPNVRHTYRALDPARGLCHPAYFIFNRITLTECPAAVCGKLRSDVGNRQRLRGDFVGSATEFIAPSSAVSTCPLALGATAVVTPRSSMLSGCGSAWTLTSFRIISPRRYRGLRVCAPVTPVILPVINATPSTTGAAAAAATGTSTICLRGRFGNLLRVNLGSGSKAAGSTSSPRLLENIVCTKYAGEPSCSPRRTRSG